MKKSLKLHEGNRKRPIIDEYNVEDGENSYFDAADEIVPIESFPQNEEISVDDNGDEILVIEKNSELDYEVERIDFKLNVVPYGFLMDLMGGLLDNGYPAILSTMVAADNSITNALIDSGKIANLNCGFLSKEARLLQRDQPINPGEWVATSLNAQDLTSGILPLPTKEPSAGLAAMRQAIEQDIANLASSADVISAIGPNSQATTVLAALQEKYQPISAIMLSFYQSMSMEFEMIYKLNAKYLDPEHYAKSINDPKANFFTDFVDGQYKILPVSDPEISNKVQRLQQAQAQLGLVEQILMMGGNPRPIIRDFLKLLGNKDADKILPDANPEQQVMEILNKNPDLAQKLSGVKSQQDAITAQQLDNAEAAKIRAEQESQAKINKTYAEIEKIKVDLAAEAAKAKHDWMASQAELIAMFNKTTADIAEHKARELAAINAQAQAMHAPAQPSIEPGQDNAQQQPPGQIQ